MTKVRIKKSPVNDCVTAEIVTAEKLGAVQIRAVVPLAKIRREMRGANERDVRRMGGQIARKLILQAAQARPAQSDDRVSGIVRLARGGGLSQFGGIEGYEDHIDSMRLSNARKALARGIDPDQVSQAFADSLEIDDKIFDAVAGELGGMGFRIRRRKRRNQRRATAVRAAKKASTEEATEVPSDQPPEEKGNDDEPTKPDEASENSASDADKPDERMAPN